MPLINLVPALAADAWRVQALPPGREYEQFRRLMTQEVNAAIAGATEVGCVANVESRHTKASRALRLGGDSEEAGDELHLPYRVSTV